MRVILLRDRHFNNDVRDTEIFFLFYEDVAKWNNSVNVISKKLKHGSANHDPVFQYVARKI